MTYRELERRFNQLQAFKIQVYRCIEYDIVEKDFIMCHTTPQQMRYEINLRMSETKNTIALTDINHHISYQGKPFNLLDNIFNLMKYDLPHDDLYDYLDRAAGCYKAELSRAKWRVYNPFFWFNRFVSGIVSQVFSVMNNAGLSELKTDTWQPIIVLLAKGAFYASIVYLAIYKPEVLKRIKELNPFN